MYKYSKESFIERPINNKLLENKKQMSKKGLIRAMRNNRVYALPTNHVRDSKGNMIKTLYTIYAPQKPGEITTTITFEQPVEAPLPFAEEYNNLITAYKFGKDYIDFEYNGYLLFMPLCIEVFRVFKEMYNPTFRKHIAQHNCLIHCCEGGMFDYRLYVLSPYYNSDALKFFLIDERTIDDETKAGISFVSCWYDTVPNRINSALFNGEGHYINLDKIHKTKYYKGNKMPKEDIKYYQTKLSGIITSVMDAFIKRYKGIIDKVRPQGDY